MQGSELAPHADLGVAAPPLSAPNTLLGVGEKHAISCFLSSRCVLFFMKNCQKPVRNCGHFSVLTE